MEGYQLAIAAVILILILVVLGMPVGFVFIVVGFFGGLGLIGTQLMGTLLGMSFYNAATSYTLAAVPLYLLMGYFALQFGFSRDLYSTAYKWVGRVPGGLAVATIFACAGFAALTGSAVAGSAAMGTIAWPEMKRYGYSPRLALGTIAAGGTLGILIPPSISLILYGLITEESIAKLFMSGIFPGIMVTIVYTIYIITRVTITPALAPPAPVVYSWRERFISLKHLWVLVTIFGIVMGGLYAGWFTASESAAAGATVVFVIALLTRRATVKGTRSSFVETVRVSGLVFIIILGVKFFGSFVATTHITEDFTAWVASWTLNRWLILIAILLMYLPLGAFLDGISMLVLTVPFVYPVIISLGFNGIWFAILLIRLIEIGQITPPLAMNVFTLKGVAPDVDIRDIWWGTGPYVVIEIFTIALLMIFPQISLFLPNAMR